VWLWAGSRSAPGAGGGRSSGCRAPAVLVQSCSLHGSLLPEFRRAIVRSANGQPLFRGTGDANEARMTSKRMERIVEAVTEPLWQRDRLQMGAAGGLVSVGKSGERRAQARPNRPADARDGVAVVCLPAGAS